MIDYLDINALIKMRHSPVMNYAVPGLTSWMIGGRSDHGCVRMFECNRNQQEAITPHSHRFDFQCLVLQGRVTNRIWESSSDRGADLYQVSAQKYCGAIGQYEIFDEEVLGFKTSDYIYSEGQRYSMKSHEIHSIFFGRDSLVLFFEGETKTDESKILQPFVGGKTVRTFETRPWMFQKGE